MKAKYLQVPAAPAVPTLEDKTVNQITLSLKEAADAGKANTFVTGIEVSTHSNDVQEDIPNKVLQKVGQ